MIKEFVKAWDKNNKDLLDLFQKENPTSYQDIVEKLVNIVISPYLKDSKNIDYPMSEGLDISSMTVIDNGDYQGTTIYIIPYETYQPSVSDYVMTNNYYGSCSGCDTFQSIELLGDNTPKEIADAGKEFHTLALHLLQSFKVLGSDD